jgi:hypothetical protein
MFEDLTEEEIDGVSGGMGNGGGGPMKVSPLDKGSGHGSCSEGILGGMLVGLFGGLATGNLIGLAGTSVGGLLGGAMAGGCFRNPPPKNMLQ